MGIQPDILLCRSEQPLPAEERRKIALFTDVDQHAVISAVDMDCIYKIPRWLHEQGLDEIVVKKLGFGAPPADLSEWDRVVQAMEHPDAEVTIAMVGKYVHLADSYKSLNEALVHAGIHTRTRVSIRYMDSERIEAEGISTLEDADAILVPGGFGVRGVEGKIAAVRYAREQRVPFLGICLGMQVAVIEFARHVASLPHAHSTEFDAATPDPVIGLVTEWSDEAGQTQTREADGDLGGTMRLGGQRCELEPESFARRIYGQDAVVERHRHRYEVNNRYLSRLREAGLRISGRSADARLVEMVELAEHPWFIGCQFHPEFTSSPRDGHPLFASLINAARAHRKERLR